jgi:hypothetical protein
MAKNLLEYPATPTEAPHLDQEELAMQQLQSIRQTPPFNGSLSGFNRDSFPAILGRFAEERSEKPCSDGAALNIAHASFVLNLHLTTPLQTQSPFKHPS